MTNYISTSSIILFVLLWITFGAFIIWFSHVRDGWRHLAKHYRTSQLAKGKAWVMQSGTIGGGDYRNVLTLTANADGLFMEVFPLVSYGRPPLFIPWGEFHNPIVGTAFLWRNVKVEVGSPPITTVRLPAAVFEQTEGHKLLANSHV